MFWDTTDCTSCKTKHNAHVVKQVLCSKCEFKCNMFQFPKKALSIKRIFQREYNMAQT